MGFKERFIEFLTGEPKAMRRRRKEAEAKIRALERGTYSQPIHQAIVSVGYSGLKADYRYIISEAKKVSRKTRKPFQVYDTTSSIVLGGETRRVPGVDVAFQSDEAAMILDGKLLSSDIIHSLRWYTREVDINDTKNSGLRRLLNIVWPKPTTLAA